MQEKLKTLLSLMLFSMVACKQKIPDCPECKVWATDAENQTISRSQDNLLYKTSDPEFNDFICMRDVGFQAFVSTYINGCKEWKQIRMVSPKKLTDNLTDEQIKKLKDYTGEN